MELGKTEANKKTFSSHFDAKLLQVQELTQLLFLKEKKLMYFSDSESHVLHLIYNLLVKA